MRSFARLVLAGLALAPASSSCRSHAPLAEDGPPRPPIPGATLVDHLIRPEERHFAHLWKVTSGGENAEAYWSFDGDRLVLQRSDPSAGVECDRIYVTSESGGALELVSSGRGKTTCAYFLPDGRSVLYATTEAVHEACPPPPDRSRGYVWPIHPEFDVVATELATGQTRALVAGPGYDAEATISPHGDAMVFTSTRSGDLELWVATLEGERPVQVTDRLGYDGGAFFSHDGSRLVFRSTEFPAGEAGEAARERYRELLRDGLVAPTAMEIWTVAADGSGLERVTRLGGANWAPSFFPDDRRIVFSSNHHDDRRPALDFELWAVDLDGSNLERITFFDEGPGRQFDAFPLFSPDGRWLAFSSNRGADEAGETNVFVAQWQ